MIFPDQDNTTTMTDQREVYLLEKKQEMENMEVLICLDLVNITHLKTKVKVYHLV